MSTSAGGGMPDWSRDTFTGFLTGESEMDNRNIRMLLETVSLGNSTVPFEAFLRSVVEKTLMITTAERCLLLLLEGDELVVRAALDSELREIRIEDDYSRSIPYKVLRTGEAVSVHGPEGGKGEPTESMVDFQLRTVMCAPMRTRDEIIGVLYVDSQFGLQGFTESDLKLFKALSCLLAASIDHTTLVRAKQDLIVAGEIQRRLLPTKGMRFPGVEVYGASRPCDETGGDYFDYFSLDDGCVSLTVADVSGHGVGAAMLMATTRAVLRAHTAVERDPGKVIRYVNEALARDTTTGRYLTMFYAELDLTACWVRYVRAGHEVPLLFRGETGEFARLDGPGFMVGVDPTKEYRTAGPVEIKVGDVIVLFTDGITEAPRIGRERGAPDRFGEERLARVVRMNHQAGAQEIVEAVFTAVERYTGTSAKHDDRTLVVAKIL